VIQGLDDGEMWWLMVTDGGSLKKMMVLILEVPLVLARNLEVERSSLSFLSSVQAICQ
jgi:hypothetical protein